MKTTMMFPIDDFESLDNENCNERGSELRENRLLFAIKSTLIMIDRRDGILDNDLTINNVKKVCDMAIKENTDQYNRNLRQQKILDKLNKW
jgi:hypothetical protein